MTFVLIHGNWHAGSAWDGVVRRLRSLGHNAHAPTVAVRGTGQPMDVGHQAVAQTLVDYILDRDLTDLVLVGHSGGGTTISQAVELIPQRVRRLVYLSGYVLKDGESQNDFLPADYRSLFRELAANRTDNTITVPFELWRTSFINDADDDLARWAYRKLAPEHYSLITDPVKLTKFFDLDIPKSYILPTADITLPRDTEWGWHPKATSRLGEHRFLEIAGSHEVMFTNPDGLADTLVEAAVD